jgi:type VI protein secretion system component VasK
MTDDNPYESPRETSSEDRGQSLGATDYVAAGLWFVILYVVVGVVGVIVVAWIWPIDDAHYGGRPAARAQCQGSGIALTIVFATVAGWLGAQHSLARAKGRAARLAALHEEQQLAIQSAKQRKAATKSEIRNPKQI